MAISDHTALLMGHLIGKKIVGMRNAETTETTEDEEATA